MSQVWLWDETSDRPAASGAVRCATCTNEARVGRPSENTASCYRCANRRRAGKVWCGACDGEGVVEGRDSLLRRIGERRCATCGGSGMVDP